MVSTPTANGVLAAPDELVLESMGAVAYGWRSLADLELTGRALVTAMRSHMAEIGQTMDYLEYFRRYYSDMAAEFVQADDDGFVTHHCVRTLFGIWQEEIERLVKGPVGATLARHLVTLPSRESAVRVGRQALASSWYGDADRALRSGAKPVDEIVGNTVLLADACTLTKRDDLFFAQFLIWSTHVWARQAAVMWQLLRETINLRRQAEELLPAGRLAESVKSNSDAYRTAADGMRRAYGEWRATHLGSVEVHDSIPRHQIYGDIGRWVAGFGDRATQWTIKEPLKNEMYREVAAAVATLRGEPLPVALPQFRYWRRTPWTPHCLSPNASGLPPFGTAAALS